MSDEPRQPALPDDPTDWPDDPYLVLGVARGAAAAEVRRAYTGLIRRFRPEQHPEQFRRIREAYERLTAATPAAPFVVEFQPRDPQSDGPPRRPRPARPSADAKPKRKSPRGHPLDDFWPLAERGDWPAAYQHLLTSDPRGRTSSRIAAALYWSLKLHPELDRARRPIDWLLESILARGPRSPVVELFRQEQLATNEDPLGADLSRLLAAPLTRNEMFDMVMGRWQAADRRTRLTGDSRKARASLGQLIMADLEVLRAANWQGQEFTWGVLLTRACGFLNWLDDEQSRKSRAVLFAELEALLELKGWYETFDSETARLEFIARTNAEYHATRRSLFEFGGNRRFLKQAYELVSVARLQPEEYVQRLKLTLVTDLTRSRTRHLPLLDAMRTRAPSLLAQINSLLEDRDPEPLSPALATLATHFVRSTNSRKYDVWREDLIRFCIRERVLPMQVANCIVHDKDLILASSSHLSQLIAADLPLSILCRAALRFWSG